MFQAEARLYFTERISPVPKATVFDSVVLDCNCITEKCREFPNTHPLHVDQNLSFRRYVMYVKKN